MTSDIDPTRFSESSRGKYSSTQIHTRRAHSAWVYINNWAIQVQKGADDLCFTQNGFVELDEGSQFAWLHQFKLGDEEQKVAIGRVEMSCAKRNGLVRLHVGEGESKGEETYLRC